jgi:cyclic pyranopterin phosphate synthase
MADLTHFDEKGRARMVDVSDKPATRRQARARAFVKMSAETVARLGDSPKGSPLEIARIAGIAAAKRTPELIPLCHPLPLTHIDVDASVCENGVELLSTVSTTAGTGVEMEALTAVAVAALTIYDMCKALDRGMEIISVCLLEKSGGRSGRWRRKTKPCP